MEKDFFKGLAYMMASDKLDILLFQMNHTMDFIEEYNLQSDEEAKLVLGKAIDRINLWLRKH